MRTEKRERIARLLKDGPISDAQAAALLGVDRATVARVRAALGLPVYRHRLKMWTWEEFERTAPMIKGGHRLWKGRVGPSGVPMANRTLTAFKLSFRLHHGREPVGKVTRRCRKWGCIEGSHLVDRPMRQAGEDVSALTELPAEATWRGMDIVAIRKCLFGPRPWPPLSLDEARLAFRFSDPNMPCTELSKRLGLCATTVERYRKKGVPS